MKHERFMEECLRLASRGEGSVSPNPMVGAVLVRNGRIVSRGYHRFFGGPHAEIECLSRFKGNPAGSALYVNLEPCSHAGKTPPCVDAIIAAGIPRVVVAMTDPNPLVAGRGIRKLRRAGIRVDTGVLGERARALNRIFARHIVARRPYVHVKVALTLDGKIGTLQHEQIIISSRESRALVHQWRARYDAVLIGAGTVVADNPSLTVRLAKGRNPHAVVLDGAFRVPLDARLFGQRARRRAFLCVSARAAAKHPRKMSAARARGITVLTFPASRDRIRLQSVLNELYLHQIGSILVEGGSGIFGTFAAEGPIDELSLFIAPRVLGSGLPAFDAVPRGGLFRRNASAITVQPSGDDLLIRAQFD